ncbi:4-(cytidine 5'-diphospho)-2-C-methyl-D-erythritol kinase [Alkalilimnicola ehrlichii]|uniref:4-diphosphocytidyl-2-C-methyl-D-erythritol kinase n=1 Tax=Alkalilimnicola ehrlichii TaxID=351052 RepID=A0A3E0X1E5_9GAMM|nr:4-(cytidine 5'-diphospho)-2-C-methyl-D-erythritol kinase [Alkalilimnicola ehrlichii]RFA31297.1 4-(cytidine 5'-diphospho)-2-C-methyl-D-erythritol kinase [Alkalilimnicola ehrlichii]RFA39431.1 4-(cytidine 5'-diphospho)-2-C-methyl-D-erythritol kinase [Alkalilimnicola ehrlichii]
MSVAIEWPAPAKLNLFLHVLGRRDDGYHELQTVFQLLDYGDSLRFDVRRDGRIQRKPARPIAPEQDLCVRAASLLQEASGTTLGADIALHKRLPMGGGVGGGSSNAATVLVALNTLWQTGLTEDELAELGLRLGADVPVFVRGRSAWAEGVGERLAPVSLDSSWFLVLHPGCKISTRQIFCTPELTRNSPSITMSAFRAGQARNDCEPVVRSLYPEVARALDWLAGFGQARLTGTGACLFAEFDDEAQAREVLASVPKPWQGFVARGVDESPLRSRVKAATAAA